MYILIALVFFFGKLGALSLVFFVCIYWILGSIIAPAWNSWMGDLVDEKKRGDYFGGRNRISGFASFISLLVGGYLLQRFTFGQTQYYGFLIIFGLALLSRVISFVFLTQKYEPPYHVEHDEGFNLREFVRKARYENYEMFVFYMCFMNLGVYLAAPFFTAYMLYDVKLGYMQYTVLLAASLIVKYLSMPVWGKASDRFGTRKVLSLSSFLMPLSPLLWLFSSNYLYLFIIQMYNGFVWAGFELASFNYLFDVTQPNKRATAVAYYNVLCGVGIFIGGIAGSIIVAINPIHSVTALIFWSPYIFVFLVSGFMRYLMAVIFIPRLKEVRPVETIMYPRLLVQTVRATVPTMEIVSTVSSLKKKLKKHAVESVDDIEE
jgi:MFS family permease